MAETIGIISNYLETKILEHMFFATPYYPPEVKYVALYTSVSGATDSDTGAEVENSPYSANQYDRFRISASSTDSRFIISGSTAYNQEEYLWGEVNATLYWGKTYGWGIRDGASGGNLLFWGLFDTAIPKPSSNMVMTIGIGKMLLSLSVPNKENGGWTATAATKIIDWLTNGSTVAPIPWDPSYGVNIALGRNIIFDAGNNWTNWTEVSSAYTDYSQQVISASSWTWVNNSTINNTDDIVFTTDAVGSWGNISDILLYDSTGGSPLYWGHMPDSVTVIPGDQFKISAHSITLTLD